MADMYAFKIESALADNVLTYNKYIQGTYHVVATITDRDALTIKNDTDDGVIVKGSLVYVSEEEKTYRYDGTAYVEEAAVETDGWKYKGTVATSADLPVDATKGDIYTITSKEVEGEVVADGHNYFCSKVASPAQLYTKFPVFDTEEIRAKIHVLAEKYPYFLVHTHTKKQWHFIVFSDAPVGPWISPTTLAVQGYLVEDGTANPEWIGVYSDGTYKESDDYYDAKTITYNGTLYHCTEFSSDGTASGTYAYDNAFLDSEDCIMSNYEEPFYLYGSGSDVYTTPTTLLSKDDALSSDPAWKLVSGVDNGGGGDSSVTEEITVQLGDDHVGNFATGHVIAEGTTLTEVLKDMLVKRIPPTYTDPSVKITVTPALIEKDIDTEVTYTITFTKNDAGDLTEIGGEDITAGTTSPYEVTKTLNETYEQTCYAKYAEGPIKKDNLGEDYPEGHIEAGEVDSKVTVTAVYPFYYGVSNSNTVDAAFVKAGTKDLSKKGDKKYTYTANNQYLWFAYNSTYGNVTHIIDPNNFENLSDFESKTVTVGNATYKVYITTGDSAKKTCSNFTYTIKF